MSIKPKRKNEFPRKYPISISQPNKPTVSELVNYSIRGEMQDPEEVNQVDTLDVQVNRLIDSFSTLVELLYLKGKIGRADVYKIANEPQPQGEEE